MMMLRWLLGRDGSADDTPLDEGESGESGGALRLPTRMPIDLRRASREQRRAVGGWWRDERGEWHRVED